MRLTCTTPMRVHRGRGSAAGQAADNGWAANMGTIVKFPDEGRIVRFGRVDTAEESATVIILPVVRIERHDEPRAEGAEPHTPSAGGQWRSPTHETPLSGRASMSPRVGRLRETLSYLLAILVLLALAGCTSIGDFGRLQQPVVADNIHAWVGQEAAARAGAPISLDNLTEDERTLRDLAFPLIEPPYDRSVGTPCCTNTAVKREFQRALWVVDPDRLLPASAGRRLSLDGGPLQPVDRRYPQRRGAHRSVLRYGAPRRRARPAPPGEPWTTSPIFLRRIGSTRWRASARTHLTIAWVQSSLAQRCAGYRFALDHLVVAEPENVAAQADIALSLVAAANRGQPVGPDAALCRIAARRCRASRRRSSSSIDRERDHLRGHAARCGTARRRARGAPSP